MKTFLAWRTRLLTVAFLVASSVCVHAQFTFTTNNGAITITGYTGPGGAVVIPAATNGWPVTTIGTNAFKSDTTIASLTIPDGVTNVGGGAFSGCSQLTSISFPDSVSSIGYGVCGGCSSLTNFSIGSGATNIGTWAGNGNLDNIGGAIVDGCSQLSAITVDSNNVVFSSLDGVLFTYGQQLLVRCPEGKSGSYTIPDTVTNTSYEAFKSCSHLGDITTGNGLLGMGAFAFNSCADITNVTISSGLTNAGAIDFVDLSGLTTISVDSNNPAYSSVNGILFDRNQTALVAYPSGKTNTSYTIPTGVTLIQSNAFNPSAILTTIIIPATVTNIGSSAFYNCYNLTGVYFEGNAPTANGSGLASLYEEIGLKVYYLPGTLGWSSTIDGIVPTTPWTLPYPLILNNGPGFGINTNQFGFTVSWATNLTVVVEASTNLAGSFWQPVATNALTGGTFYFSDASSTNYPARFYRLRSP